MRGASFLCFKSHLLILALLLAVAACSTPRYSGSPDPHYKVGQPYKVNGRWYHPKEEPNYDAEGMASWYGPGFHGRMTANGEIFDMNLLSAAHTTLPLPSMVEVVNLNNGRKTVVRVNDRGPFAHGRIIDLSREAARRLGFEKDGVARVNVRYLGPALLMAKAPRKAPRIARATPVTPATINSPGENSALLSSIEEAPALTPGAEEFAVAQSQREGGERAPVPASNLSTSAPSAVEMVNIAAGPETPVRLLYMVRVAALSQLDNIETLRRQLDSIGPLRVSLVDLDNGSRIYRINMGPFASIETAAERLDAVRAAGYDDAALVTLTP